MAYSITFRQAQRQDVPLILSFIRRLAAHEGMPDGVYATEKALEKHLFEDNAAQVLFICEGEREIGFALYFFGFSSYPCKPYLFINDLFISHEHRGKGCGKLLLGKLVEIALERGCCRIELLCFEGNDVGRRFYDGIGAELKSELLVYRKQV